MLRVSVTDIDKYLYWLDHPELEFGELRDDLLKMRPATMPMIVGTALHEALDRAADGITDVIQCDGFKIAIECEIVLEPMILRESKIESVVGVSGHGLVELVGKVDTSDTVTVVDYKTTTRFDPEALVDGMQWRFYLWLTGATRFVWEVFEVKDPLRDEPGRYRITAHHRVEQRAYPGMRDDCLHALEDFVAMVRTYLPDYVAAKSRPDPAGVAS